MKQHWEILIAILDEMLALYQAILTLSQEKRTILVAADGQKLEQITKQEELLILQAGKLENQRIAKLKEISGAGGVLPDDITLEKMIELADEASAKRLTLIGSEFDKVLAELVKINQVNTQLIQRALTFVNYNINILAQSESGSTYAPKGQTGEKPAPARALFDHKV
ncbi:hypothetical protein SDC9_44042 [bioreactor metagenome]|uniref:FlgN protein n=1 Tax=bioreactor metagenome TaxID=1076179 RepID=A0A644W2M7_9ZZZZ